MKIKSGETSKDLASYTTYIFAKECIELMELSKDVSHASHAYMFVASNALELIAKSYMVLRWHKLENLSLNEIEEKSRSYRHDLDRMFSSGGVGDEFLALANIDRVSVKKSVSNGKDFNKFTYQFFTNDGLINIYNVETLRYGTLAKNKNDFVIMNPQQIFNLCKLTQDAMLAMSKKILK